MIDRSAFFNACRAGIMGPELSQAEVDGCTAILDAMEGQPIPWIAYALATAWHETAFTMLPIKERGGDRYFEMLYGIHGKNPSRARQMGNTEPGDGTKYCGRGFVQLTWKLNYRRMGDLLMLDLVGDPDLALQPPVAAKIMREGMVRGLFTGKTFRDFLPDHDLASKSQFIQARRIINGQDKAATIAEYAQQFQRNLLHKD